MTRNNLLGALAAITTMALMLAETQSAKAQTVRPFVIAGAGVVEFVPATTVPPGNMAVHVTTGWASYIGRHVARGKVAVLSLNPTTNPPTGTFRSVVPTVFQGQHGTLKYHYGHFPGPGVVKLLPASNGKVIAVWDAIFTLVGQTRTVADSRFRMIAVTEPFVFGSTTPVKFAWSGKGTITFRR